MLGAINAQRFLIRLYSHIQLTVSAAVILTHFVGIKVTHLG